MMVAIKATVREVAMSCATSVFVLGHGRVCVVHVLLSVSVCCSVIVVICSVAS